MPSERTANDSTAYLSSFSDALHHFRSYEAMSSVLSCDTIDAVRHVTLPCLFALFVWYLNVSNLDIHCPRLEVCSRPSVALNMYLSLQEALASSKHNTPLSVSNRSS
jgi:hypothetical protein